MAVIKSCWFLPNLICFLSLWIYTGIFIGISVTSEGWFSCFAAWRLLIFFKSHFQIWIFLYLLPVTHQFCHIKFWQYFFYLFFFFMLLCLSIVLFVIVLFVSPLSFSRLIPFFLCNFWHLPARGGWYGTSYELNSYHIGPFGPASYRSYLNKPLQSSKNYCQI